MMDHYCISHSKDVDGLCSASLVVSSHGCKFNLASYDNFLEIIDSVPREKHIIVCDIGTNSKTEERFIELLKSFKAATYIDHHYITEKTKNKIISSGIEYIHDTSECASMLTYLHFKDMLKQGMEELALYGAITDYMDSSKNSTKIMERKDRHRVLLDATLLSHAIADKDIRFRREIVRYLASGKKPHQSRKIWSSAISYMRKLDMLYQRIKEKSKVLNRIAYVETDIDATGNVAKIILESFTVPVAVAYKRERDGWVEVSLRSTSECKIHLGKTIGSIALSLDGSGGGHERAAGCRIRMEDIGKMLEKLDSVV
jgi:oligoribonuclease NrnB/cAMP/cGMP phosphodiesterase (DHH superfamily)